MPVLRLALATAALLMLLAGAAQAAPIGALKQYKIPTPNSEPRDIARGADGNFWFTEANENLPAQIGRVTPAGAMTEFGGACEFCILTDIAQGPDPDVLFFTSNDPFLGRITTAGEFLAPIVIPSSSAVGGDLAVHGTDVWFNDFNDDNLWRYDTLTGQFTAFRVPDTPTDVAVDAAGTVWFTINAAEGAIGELDPATGGVTVTTVGGFMRAIAVATDGDVWFTHRFTPQGVGRLDPVTHVVTEFPVADGAGPEGITAAPGGGVWITQTLKGNVARVSDAGAITEGKAVKGSEPFGITTDSTGDPWWVMGSANKIGELQLR
jgi:streptogramin lyase